MAQVKDDELLKRLAIDPKVMLGKPVIRGTRLTVEYIIDRLANGATPADITSEYDGVTAEDITACLLFAENDRRRNSVDKCSIMV